MKTNEELARESANQLNDPKVYGAVLAALNTATQQQEAELSSLREDKAALQKMCEHLAAIGSLTINQPSEKHQQEWDDALEEYEPLRATNARKGESK